MIAAFTITHSAKLRNVDACVWLFKVLFCMHVRSFVIFCYRCSLWGFFGVKHLMVGKMEREMGRQFGAASAVKLPLW